MDSGIGWMRTIFVPGFMKISAGIASYQGDTILDIQLDGQMDGGTDIIVKNNMSVLLVGRHNHKMQILHVFNKIYSLHGFNFRYPV